jgi:hypothetical protein
MSGSKYSYGGSIDACYNSLILLFVTTAKWILYIACFKISHEISEDILYVTSTVEMNELRDPCAFTAATHFCRFSYLPAVCKFFSRPFSL